MLLVEQNYVQLRETMRVVGVMFKDFRNEIKR